MMINKIVALVLLTLGSLSLMDGVAGPALANPLCDGSVFEPETECAPAHAVIRELLQPIDLTCSSNGTICYTAIDSQCGSVSGFQLATKGVCVVTLETSEEDSCEEDTYSTFVPLEHYITQCMFEGTECNCVFLKSNDHPTQYSEVCDCAG